MSQNRSKLYNVRKSWDLSTEFRDSALKESRRNFVLQSLKWVIWKTRSGGCFESESMVSDRYGTNQVSCARETRLRACFVILDWNSEINPSLNARGTIVDLRSCRIDPKYNSAFPAQTNSYSESSSESNSHTDFSITSTRFRNFQRF